jgi:hypothetical protein
MKTWQRHLRRIEKGLNADGIVGITSKLVIHDGQREHDLYVKIGWWRGRPVWVDVTLARNSGDASGDTFDIPAPALPVVIDLRRRLIENSRALTEIACRQASLLLSSHRCSLTELSDLWRATTGEPRGKCSQVVDIDGDRVHGPLDAAAKLFRLRCDEWEKRMKHEYTDEEIEGMIADCQKAVEENPDVFSKFESEFIESVADANETAHLTEKQIEKLEQIWEERAGG